jgi:hypothetical protein
MCKLEHFLIREAKGETVQYLSSSYAVYMVELMLLYEGLELARHTIYGTLLANSHELHQISNEATCHLNEYFHRWKKSSL